MGGEYRFGTRVSLDNLVTKKVRLERRIDDIFHEFKAKCDFHIPYSRGVVEHCLHKDNCNLVEIVGGGYFTCTVDDCPIRDKA